MIKPLDKMTIDELVSPIAALAISHPHFGVLRDYAFELRRRNEVMMVALGWAKHHLRAEGVNTTFIQETISDASGDP